MYSTYLYNIALNDITIYMATFFTIYFYLEGATYYYCAPILSSRRAHIMRLKRNIMYRS